MTSVQKPRGYWTKETCRIEARKYKTRSEFQKVVLVLMTKHFKMIGLMKFVHT